MAPSTIGTDPEISERSSSALELLFDLTYAVSVGVAADQLAELVASNQIGSGIIGFVFGMVAILVSWINFSWFASAFDTDDLFHRMCTMIQMIGVIVVALGLPTAFKSIVDGPFVDIRILVTGYVIMRLAMIALWMRTARREPAYRTIAHRNAAALVVVQIGWIALAIAEIPLGPTIVAVLILGVAELAVPVFAQGRAEGTPWHPLHIADRYSAFAIITLGEGVVGTVASSSGILGGRVTIDAQAVLLIVAGIGITFAAWWIYFCVPFGRLLVARPARAYVFGYGHIPVYIAIAAIGAGLRVVGRELEGSASLDRAEVTATVALPVLLYLLAVGNLAAWLGWGVRRIRVVTPAITGAFILGAIAAAAAGLSLEAALIIVMGATMVTAIGWELSNAYNPHVPSGAQPLGPAEHDPTT